MEGRAQAGSEGRFAARTGGRECERARERDSSCGSEGLACVERESEVDVWLVETRKRSLPNKSRAIHCSALLNSSTARARRGDSPFPRNRLHLGH